MKKKFLFLAIFVAATSIAFAQDNLQHYYRNIYKAEDFILLNRLDSSALFLRSAFAHKQAPFGRHIYLAAVVHAKLRNFKKVPTLLVSLLELGLPFEKFTEGTMFSTYIKSPEGKKLSRNLKNIIPTYDTVYRNRIKLMIDRDQHFRIKPGSYTRYGDTIKKIDRENIDTFLMLVKTKGFPTEQKVGINEHLTFSPLYALLVIHQSGPVQQYNFSDMIRKHVENGAIENKEGYFLFNRQSGGQFMSLVRVQHVKPIDSTRSTTNPANHNVLKTSDWGYFRLSPLQSEKENRLRAEFFMEPYDKSIKKALFTLKNVDFEQMENKSSVSTLVMLKQEHYDAQVADLSF